jgi:hypothetical protein
MSHKIDEMMSKVLIPMMGLREEIARINMQRAEAEARVSVLEKQLDTAEGVNSYTEQCLSEASVALAELAAVLDLDADMMVSDCDYLTRAVTQTQALVSLRTRLREVLEMPGASEGALFNRVQDHRSTLIDSNRQLDQLRRDVQRICDMFGHNLVEGRMDGLIERVEKLFVAAANGAEAEKMLDKELSAETEAELLMARKKIAALEEEVGGLKADRMAAAFEGGSLTVQAGTLALLLRCGADEASIVERIEILNWVRSHADALVTAMGKAGAACNPADISKAKKSLAHWLEKSA